MTEVGHLAAADESRRRASLAGPVTAFARFPAVAGLTALAIAMSGANAQVATAQYGNTRLVDAVLLPPGRVTEHTIQSRVLGQDRHVWVYTPPGHRPGDTLDDNLVLGFDGAEYTGEIPLPTILDSLIVSDRIPPTIAVLIDDASGGRRLADLANHARFASFVTDELMPWIRQHYRVSRDPRRTIITGSSAGGLAAAYLAFKRPDLFGNVLSQSGAFWRGDEGTNGSPYEWLTAQFRAAPRKPIHFFIDVGSTESRGAMGGAAPSILVANRRLRDVLRAKGYAVEYFEVPGGRHDPADWRLRLPAGLVALAIPAR